MTERIDFSSDEEYQQAIESEQEQERQWQEMEQEQYTIEYFKSQLADQQKAILERLEYLSTYDDEGDLDPVHGYWIKYEDIDKLKSDIQNGNIGVNK